MELLVYEIRFESKVISYLLIFLIYASENLLQFIIKSNAKSEIIQNLSFQINNIINNDISIYIIGVCSICMFVSSIFTIVFVITFKDENSKINKERYSEIRRKFQFKEHII